MTPVTALICVRDGARYLAEAIASIHAQSHPVAELLVVDDGSNDGSAALADAMGARVLVQPPLGLGTARNKAFQAARHELVVVLDADDRLRPRAVAQLVAGLQSHDDAVGCCGRRQQFLSPDVDPAGCEQVLGGVDRAALLTGGLWTRASALACPFDPALLACDMDWINQQRELGGSIVEIDELVLERRVHRTNMSRSDDVRASYLRVARASLLRRQRAGEPTTS